MQFWNLQGWLYDALFVLRPHRELVASTAALLADQELVLDAGCGSGRLSEWSSARVVGADASATMLREARGRSDHLVQADLCRTLPFADDAFDAVVSLNVLYTLSDPDAALSEFRRVLKPDGLLRLATPVTGALVPLVREHVRTAGPRELARSVLSIPRLAAWMLMLTIRRAFEGSQFTFRSEEELIDLVEAAGFEIISAEPCYAGIDRMVVARKPS